MHVYFWNMEAFEVFESRNLWFFTEYLCGGGVRGVARDMLGVLICTSMCAHGGESIKGGKEA